MQLRSVALATLLCTAFLPGCDKVDQCNKLIDTINNHTPKMTKAMESLGDAATNPKVVDDYEGVVQTTLDELDGLELSDESVVGFAKRYEGLLQEAKSIGADMRDALTDPTKIQGIQAKTTEVRQTEATLVKEVNTYCGGS